MDNEDLDFSNYIAGFKRDKLKIFLCAVVCGLLALGFTLIVPPIFESSVVYVFPQEDSGNAVGALIRGTSAAGPSLLIVKGLIESRATPLYVESHLPADLKPIVQEKDLEKSIKVVYDDDSAQLEIDTFWAKRPDISLSILNLVTRALDHYNKGSYISIAQQKKGMLELAVKQRDTDLHVAEDAVIAFQKLAKTVPDPTNPFNSQYVSKLKDAQFRLDDINHEIDIAQSEASKMASKALDMPTAIPQQESWRSQLIEQQYQLSQLQVQYGDSAPAVVKLKADIEITKKNLVNAVQQYLSSVNIKVDSNLAQLEANRLILTWQVDYLNVLAKAAPSESVKLQNLVAEALARSDALKLARMDLEQAKLDADSTPVKWSVLVPPYIQEKPVNKKYGLYPLLGIIIGCILGWGWSGRKQYVLMKRSEKSRDVS